MCASCGCGKPNDTHGDSRHITLDQVQKSASAAGISAHEAAKNILSSVQQSPGGSQQGQQASAND